MSALQKFKTFFSKNVLLCLTVPMVVFSLLVPQPFVWMGQNISIDLSGIPFLKENFPSLGFVNMLLCVIMFGMGMTLKADDFKYIFKKPTDVLIGICSQYVFMAGFGWLVASLLSLTGVGDPTVRAQIAVGLVLLGCVIATVVHQIIGPIVASMFAAKPLPEEAEPTSEKKEAKEVVIA